MFTWNYSETVNTQASPEQVWDMWSDANTWPSWDSELDWVRLEGEFKEGAKGTMKPVNGPVVTFTLSEVLVNRSFSDRAKLPLTSIVFKHHYLQPSEKGEMPKIQHAVEMKGLLVPLFKRVIGTNIKKHLRGAVLELSSRALTNDKTFKKSQP